MIDAGDFKNDCAVFAATKNLKNIAYGCSTLRFEFQKIFYIIILFSKSLYRINLVYEEVYSLVGDKIQIFQFGKHLAWILDPSHHCQLQLL